MPDDSIVCEYKPETLKSLLTPSVGRLSSSGAAVHLRFLQEYLADDNINAHTVVIENEYVDRDYLEDHAAYYHRCFGENKYRKYCRRLHFFQNSFSEVDLTSLLQGQDSLLSLKALQDAYIGFVVLRPLPEAVIGRTCLKTYTEDGTGRHYHTVREYAVSLFGLALKINSMAFQEQDSVLAACATTAIWSAFQTTGIQFQHSIPTPVEITRAATESFPLESRSIPSQGLNVVQIAGAIRAVGLEPVYINLVDEFVFKNATYAYLSAGFPLILGGRLADPGSWCTPATSKGWHSITLAGFRLDSQATRNVAPEEFATVADRMVKVYGHDDQVGPFARMNLDGRRVKLPGKPGGHFSLSTSWVNGERDGTPLRLVPSFLLVPLYHKIRISYKCIYHIVSTFSGFLYHFHLRAGTIVPHLEWDIRLVRVNKYKEELFGKVDVDVALRSDVLRAQLPRFLWCASGRDGDRDVIDLVFDATDIERGDFFLRAVEYDEAFAEFFHFMSSPDVSGDIDCDYHIQRILDWFWKKSRAGTIA